IDGALSTFSYGTSTVTIVTANNRTTTLALSSGSLSTITDPDGGVRTFTYVSSRLTNDTFGMLQRGYSYSNGAAATITWGSSNGPSKSKLSPATVQGIYVAQPMGAPSPSAAGPIQATLTDPNTHVTAWQ